MKYVDVNVFVYWLSDHPLFGERATNIIERIEKGERSTTSALTIWLLHVILEEEAEDYSLGKLLQRIGDLKYLRVEPLTSEDFVIASKNEDNYSMDLEDALHFSVCERLGIREIYSNDDDFDRTPLKRTF